jgi:uncharacterized protein (DUF1800 family)
VPAYRGSFGSAQAERLLRRAGFGAQPGEAKKLAAKGLRAAVLSLTRPQPESLHGPLVEQMVFVWRNWFAISHAEAGPKRLLLAQNRLLGRLALDTFEKLLLSITKDQAMLIRFSGTKNTKDALNETYARALMERFTLGADRPGGFTEQDVHEQARALTGWRNEVSAERGPYCFRFDPQRHDHGRKTIFGRTGNFDWKDSCRLCLQHPNHPSFFVGKLWSYFVPTPPPPATLEAVGQLYLSRGYAVRPVLEAILMHPQLYLGPPMAKPSISSAS